MMNALFNISTLLLLLASSVMAGREAPEAVPSISTREAVYSVPHFVAINGNRQNGGFIQAHHPKTKELLWTVKVYMTRYDNDREDDVQDVFIKSLSLDEEHNLLILSDEKSRVYALDLATKEVILIRQEKPGNAPEKYPGPEKSEKITTKEIIRILEHARIRATTTTHSGNITIYLKNGKRYDGVFVAAEAGEAFSGMGASNVVRHFLNTRPADEVIEWAGNAEQE